MCHSVSTVTLKVSVLLLFGEIRSIWGEFHFNQLENVKSYEAGHEVTHNLGDQSRPLKRSPMFSKLCKQNWILNSTIYQLSGPGETVDSRFTSPAGTSNRIGRSLWSRHDLGEHRGHQVMQGNLSNLYQNKH